MAEYDVVVIGGGIAGLTAGLFAARYGRSTLVLEPQVPGGHLVNVERIDDFPGFLDGVAGFDLGPTVQEQAANAGAEFRMAEVERLSREGDELVLATSDGEIRARAAIVATGRRPRPLGVPGEERLVGRGISHCATCDGPLYRGKSVGVVGGGTWGLQEALTLAGHADKVIVFEREAELPGQHAMLERARESGAIALRSGAAVEEVLGESAVAGVRLRTASGVEDVDLAGLFVYAGESPASELLADLIELDAGGHVPVDASLATAVPGLFAAGDLRQGSAGHAIAAAGDGATAALAAHRYLG